MIERLREAGLTPQCVASCGIGWIGFFADPLNKAALRIHGLGCTSVAGSAILSPYLNCRCVVYFSGAPDVSSMGNDRLLQRLIDLTEVACEALALVESTNDGSPVFTDPVWDRLEAVLMERKA